MGPHSELEAGWGPGRVRRRRWPWIVAALGLLGLGGYVCLTLDTDYPADDPVQNSFDGGSEELKQTVVVPTLDTEIPDRLSAIWCSSFQLAWNRLKSDVTHGPIQLSKGQALADRLNGAVESEQDLELRHFYAAAGFVGDGIIPKIQTDMARRFPQVSVSVLEGAPDGAVAYGYLRAQVKFRTPLLRQRRGLLVHRFHGQEGPREVLRDSREG